MLRVRRRVNRYRERESDMRGMTWDHARGYDPLVAASRAWAEAGGEAIAWDRRSLQDYERSEEHTSELQSLMRISYAVFCLKKKKKQIPPHTIINAITTTKI